MNLLEIEIKTNRLRLIPVSTKYRNNIFQEFSAEITTYMFPKPADKIEETDEFISESQKNMEKGEEIVLVILDKETDEFLGIAGLHHIDKKDPEFGIWLKKSAHGNAYGREAMQAVKKWADEHIQYEYLKYPVDKRNIASRKVAESMGGKVVKEYQQTGMAGQKLDEVEYHIYPKTN